MPDTIKEFIDWMPDVIGITMGISIFILSPLTVFRRTRGFAGIGLVAASWILGAILWIYGVLATFSYWGIVGLFLGLLVFGIGVVPMAFLALALDSQWEWVRDLGILFASVVVSRIGGALLIENAERSKFNAVE